MADEPPPLDAAGAHRSPDPFLRDRVSVMLHRMPNYLKLTWQYLEALDVISGLVKAAAFGFIVALMGCYHGFHSKGGAQGVGIATTNAVVSPSVLILAANCMITAAFFGT